MTEEKYYIKELAQEIFDLAAGNPDFAHDFDSKALNWHGASARGEKRAFHALENLFETPEQEQLFQEKVQPFLCDFGDILLLVEEVETLDTAQKIKQVGDDFFENTKLWISAFAVSEHREPKEKCKEQITEFFVQSGEEVLFSQVLGYLEDDRKCKNLVRCLEPKQIDILKQG